MADFNTALNLFVTAAQAIVDKHYNDNYPRQGAKLSTTKGRRYVRVVKTGMFDGEEVKGQSVYCFVDTTNGDVLKAAGWKSPAKHARGNIYEDGNGALGVTAYGATYLR